MAYRYVFSKDQPRYLNFPLQLKWFGYMANTFAKYQNKKARDGVMDELEKEPEESVPAQKESESGKTEKSGDAEK